MRKFIVASFLAVPLLAVTVQPAAAWCKFGGSWNFSCGGNKFYKDGGNPPCECNYSAYTPSCGCCCPAPCCSPCCKPQVHAHVALPPKATAQQPQPGSPIQPVDYQSMNYWNAYQQQAGYYSNYQYNYQPTPWMHFDFPAWFYNN